MPNIWNASHIDDYLREFSGNDDELHAHLRIALSKPLLKEHNCIHAIDRLPQDPPKWLSRKWDAQQQWHEWRASEELDSQVSHIRDWIKGAIVRDEDWLRHIDAQGRPEKLRRISSLDNAMSRANKAMRDGATDYVDIGDEPGAVRPLKDLEGGKYKLVQLCGLSALSREGALMGHCIGKGAFDDHLVNDTRQILSIRDRKNMPHVTLEIDLAKNVLLQCRGKSDLPPVSKYMPMVQALIKDHQYDLTELARNTGLVQQGGEYHDICNLPRGFTHQGSWNLRHTNIKTLPDDFTNEGHLYINKTSLETLGENFTCHGDFDASGTNLTEFPRGFVCSGAINIARTDIADIPDGFIAHGDFKAAHTKISEIKDTSFFYSSVDLTGTDVDFIHDGFICNGSLILDQTPIETLPRDMFIKGDLSLVDTDITELPHDLVVEGCIITPDGISCKNVAQARQAMDDMNGRGTYEDTYALG